MIAYQTAYLKSHWPTEFMAALLTADQQNTDRISVEIEECQRMGINVTRPDINQSFESFTVVTSGTSSDKTAHKDEKLNTIRFGLNAVKNLGEHISGVIIKDRKANGSYLDISNILERITDKDLNKKSLEALIKTGALDNFGERGELLGNTENMLRFNRELIKSKNNGQVSLFSGSFEDVISNKIKMESHPPIDKQIKLAWEKELLGLYVSAHPFSDYKKHISSFVSPIRDVLSGKSEEQYTIGGMITRIQKIITRTNKSMIFAKIEDDTANIEVLVFPKLLKANPEIWEQGKAVIVQGKTSDKDQDIKLLLNTAFKLSLRNINEVINKFKSAGNLNTNNNFYNKTVIPDDLDLKISLKGQIDSFIMDNLKNILIKHPGDSKVFFEILINGEKKTIESDFKANLSDYLATELKNRFGDSIFMTKIKKS
jgi:DNA polymerase-3 subunit alpha